MGQNSLLSYRYHTMPHKLNKITIHLIEDDISQRDSIESLLVYKDYFVKSYSTAVIGNQEFRMMIFLMNDGGY